MARVHLLSHTETGRTPHWQAAVWSGVLAGAIFLALELVMVPLFAGDSLWAPVRMIGAILMGSGVLPPPATFDAGVLVAALMVHFVLAVIYGLILAMVVFRLDTAAAVAAGAAGGLLLYWINFYGFTDAFPWFEMARNWITITTHIVFGAAAAWIYKGLAARQVRRETGAQAM